jgi:hypothetical protein
LSFGSVFGTVAPGESVILTETPAATFRTAWSLASSVKIFGSNTNSNLGRADQIHLYDAAGNEVDSLIYGDETGKGPRTQNKSATVPVGDLALTTAPSTGWTLASVGDAYGSWASSGNDLGNPGTYYAAPVPEPSTFALLASLLVGLACIVWHKRS